MRFDSENTILPARLITSELLSAYAVSYSNKHDHSKCTEEKCMVEEEVSQIAINLAKGVNNSPEFRAFAQKYVTESLAHGAERDDFPQALSAMAIFFVYVGWELAQF